MQSHGFETLVMQVFGQIVRAALGGGKDDRLIQIRIAQDMVKQTQLVAGIVGVQQRLRNVGVTVVLSGHLDGLRIAHHACGELANRAVQRC